MAATALPVARPPVRLNHMTRLARAISAPTDWVWLFAAAGAGIGALSVTSLTYLSMPDHGHSFARLFVWQFLCWSFWIAAAPLVVRLGGRLAATERSLGSRWTALVIVALSLLVVHIPLAALLTVWLQPYVPVLIFDVRQAALLQVPFFAIDLLAVALLVGAGYAAAGHRRARELELRESRLQHELTRARLDTLTLEVQPHFLFNTLNSVAALIRKRANAQALDMLLGLSELLRTSLERGKEPLTSVEAEVDFVRRYIELQRGRFADRLTVIYEVNDCLSCMVPTLSLQPLVENALRHGVARRRGPCRLEVAVYRESDVLHLRVSDDGVGLPAGFSMAGRSGVGLRNTAARLAEFFGDEARLDVRPHDGGGTVSEVTIPVAEALPSEARAVAR